MPIIGTFVLLSLLLLGSVPASGDSAPPAFTGGLGFPTIHGPADPEEYSWTVTVPEGGSIEIVDGQSASVRYEDGTQQEAIGPQPARDATGAEVPTSLALSGGNIITLTVYHRAGNPAAAGAAFTYPVTPGPAYQVGYSTVIFTLPAQESPTVEHCFVPRLRGATLKMSKRRLRNAGCSIGAVRKQSDVTAKSGRVVQQYPKPGREMPVGAEVDVKLD